MMLRLERRQESMLVTMGPCQQLTILDGYWAIKIGESTVHSIKKAYEEQLHECRKTGKEVKSPKKEA